MIIQGDQKVSVHLLITIQKVKSNVEKVFSPPPVSRYLLRRRTAFSKTVFNITRSTFRMYSSNHQLCGDCSNTLRQVHRDFLIILYQHSYKLNFLWRADRKGRIRRRRRRRGRRRRGRRGRGRRGRGRDQFGDLDITDQYFTWILRKSTVKIRTSG